MFNSIRKSFPAVSDGYVPSPLYEIKGVQVDGESVIEVPLSRSLVDNRVKFSSARPAELAKNGIKPGNIKIAPPIEDALQALAIVRRIGDDAEYRAQVEAALESVDVSETTKVPESTIETESEN